jgi:hypothetical protein
MRGAAAEFMRELAPKYPDAKEQLLRAAKHFEKESSILGEIGDKVFEEYKEPDPEKANKTADLFTKARDNYAQGINEIEKALQKIDPKRAERAKNQKENE